MGILSQAEIDFDNEIVDEFLAHFEVMKNSMQPAILDLSKIERYSERINELFRIFHNIKSATAYLKFEALHRIAALVEGVLEVARGKPGPACDEFIDWLLKVSDQLETWYYNLSNDDDRFAAIDFSIFNIPDLPIIDNSKEENNA